MKRYVSLFLVIIMLTIQMGASAESERREMGGLKESIQDLWGSVSEGASNAADWAKDKAEDVSEWAGETADWAKDTAGDVADWAKDTAGNVADWTKDRAGDIGTWAGNTGTWIKDNAAIAWDWTQSTASSSWDWIKSTAGSAWDVTSKTVTGTWESIFGKSNEAGPHHLCISSPLLLSSNPVGSTIEEYGIIGELYTYDDVYDIIVLATARTEDILPPSVGSMSFSDLVASCFESTTFANQEAEGVGIRAMAQELRFQAMQDGEPKFGRALGVWTDHYIVAFIISVYAETGEEGIDTQVLQEADELFDLWVNTLSIYETPKLAASEGNAVSAGELTESNRRTANRLISEYRFASNPKGGHGFAAERANDLADKIKGLFNGQRASIIGDNNIKNGADRQIIAADGTQFLIQSKYHSTAIGSIKACFDENGFRYFNTETGKPMQVEVPADQYDDAVEIMRNAIQEGRVTRQIGGETYTVTDPEQASEIVRKGTVTYKQAVRIAKAGTIESITYDAMHACVECAYSIGISATVQFAVSTWNGENLETALKLSAYTGLKVGGTSFVVSVLSSQLSKAGLNSLLVGSSETVVRLMGPKAAAVFVNAFRSGGNIYGAAAMKSAAKLLRGNAITSAVTLVVLTVPDVIDIFRGRISAKQLIKDVAKTSGGIAGGLGGWYGGAMLGTLVFPGAGTVIGGIIGSVGGGFLVQWATGAIADSFVEDDADEMLTIISQEFEQLAQEYMLNEEEANAVVDALNQTIDGNMLKNMFASTQRELYASEIILRPEIVKITDQRQVIEIPSMDVYQTELREVLEDIADEEELLEGAN